MKITLKNIIGKAILVGITFLENDDTIFSMIQFSGQIVRVDKSTGIVILSENLNNVADLIPATSLESDGDTFTLPPDISSLQKAPKGEYRLKSTGEVVINPDLLTTWTVRAPQNTIN